MERWDSGHEDGYRVETPERIDLEYDVAGIGSRTIAAMIDTLLQTVLGIILNVLSIVGLGAAVSELRSLDWIGQTAAIAVIAGLVLVNFAVLWGYFVFFELVWHGQSPGKRRAGLRVIKEGGYPISFVDSAIRNIIRPIDYLLTGAIVMVIDRRSRRLGDLAAGTLVVKERRELRPDSLVLAPAQTGSESSPAPTTYEASEATIPNTHRLTTADQSLLREYLLRRASLARPAAEALATRLAAAFAAKLEHDLAGEPADAFLERLARELVKGQT